MGLFEERSYSFDTVKSIPEIDHEVKKLQEGGGSGGDGASIYTGIESPSNDLGKIGDIYVEYDPTIGRMVFVLHILQGKRGRDELNYVGAQEIQLLLKDPNGDEINIKDLPEFAKSGIATNNIGTLRDAFNGNTGGSYWEANGTPVTVYMSALIPSGYRLSKLRVWQRNNGGYDDYWGSFSLGIQLSSEKEVELLNLSGLTSSDWSGSGYGTEWDLSEAYPRTLDQVSGVNYIKTGSTEEDATWKILKF